MEKFWSFAKWILIAIVIFLVLGFGFTVLENSTSIFSTIGSWFNSEPIIIDAFKDAPTNYIGFTKEEIKNQTSENECPSKGDIECKIYMQDYLDVVVFYKE
ncbi:MAG: hypothetical protein IJA69_05000, partial [Clostridia bacterium]|nr:hypothetical protein [Clostridia bacterium]